MGMEKHSTVALAGHASTASKEFNHVILHESNKPVVLAIIRYAHDVIRGALRDLHKAIMDHNDYSEAKDIWEHIGRWIDIYGRMEDGVKDRNDGRKVPRGFFKILDSMMNNVCSKEHMHEEHMAIHKLEDAVEEAFASWDLSVVQVVFPGFEEAMYAHLNREDELMLPAIMTLTKEGYPVHKYMQNDLIPAIAEGGSHDLEFFIKYANEILERYHDGMPRNRAFNHALWAVATTQQWDQWSQWIKESTSASSYRELMDAIQKSQAAGHATRDNV